MKNPMPGKNPPKDCRMAARDERMDAKTSFTVFL
jgi:hypothetical protein